MSEQNEIMNGEELAAVQDETALADTSTEQIAEADIPTEEAVETCAPVVEESVLTVDAPEEAESPVADETVSEDATVSVSDEDDEVEVYTEPAFDEGFLGTCERALYKAWRWIKKVLHLPDLTKKQRAMVWDKITTGILIALFATPVAVLLYILLWFILK